jgi:protein involved in polysaccharide export with SLBB domain
MRTLLRRPAIGWAILAAAFASPLAAQVPTTQPQLPDSTMGRPTPREAAQMLQNPGVAAQLQQRLSTSGMTPDQIRARLRAAGYPENLLDSYLPGTAVPSGRPAPATYEAVRALGLLTSADVDSLQALDTLTGRSDSLQRRLDSLRFRFADSLRADSLADSLSVVGRLKLFGTEVFRRTSTRFQPLEAGPVDDSYRLGSGDVLVLVLTGDVESVQSLEVTRDGFVMIPRVGQLYVANLTLGQLRDQLYTRLGRAYSGVRRGAGATTHFDVTVARLRNVQVYVVGDVVRPGSYQISAAGTVLSALYAAGGPTDNGSFRRVELLRSGKVVDSLDVYDYLLGGDSRSDLRLQTGDVVFVPVHGGYVKAAGKVERPAIYEVKPGETLRDLIRFSGGFTPDAFRARAQIYRVLRAAADSAGAAPRVVVDVAPDQFSGGTGPAVPVFGGDSVTVFALADRVARFVTVKGNVWVPGRVGFAPGMKLSEAVRLAGGPKPDVYLDRILVTRTAPDSTKLQLRAAFADSTGRITDDMALDDQDVIEIFSRTAFQPEVYVIVTGAVRKPGRIPFREGMTLRDALLVAGGLDDGADLRKAEIARIADRTTAGALAQSVEVPLDSTYLFGRFAGWQFQGAPGYPAQASGAPEVPLRPYDNVLIFRQPGWDIQRLVYLTGEVNRPGRYALQSKTERLSDLIARAGGLTDEAYAGGVQFYRVSALAVTNALQREAQQKAAAANGLSDSGTRPSDVPSPGPLEGVARERVGVDLPRVLKNPKASGNLILTGGDSVFIPEYNPVVMVDGYVNAPGPVAYEPGKSLDWYVQAAGGYAQNGDRKRAYVVLADGRKAAVQRRVLLPDDVPEPVPGSRVYVPQYLVQPQPSVAPQILGIIAQLATAVVTIIVVSRK